MEEDPAPGVPEWVVTYGDMMSLLLTFFIMLVSISELKKEGDIKALMDGMVEKFGPDRHPATASVPGSSTQRTSILNKPSSTGDRSQNGTKKAPRKADQGVGAHPTVRRINHGSVVTLGGPALFGRFEAELNDALREKLDVIASVVAKKPNRLIVRGHATPEPLPFDSKHRDQMDLSFARALAAAEYLIAKGIDRKRITVSSTGKSEQRKPTRELADQRVNRRVDVFIIDSYIASP
ncbi:MAG: OmpA family protein [Planctomycetota bacterium]|nr:OmpA family protein [Planctomycetota bacterium]